MDPIFGVDYSWARPGGKALAKAGAKFAVRYLAYPGHGGKAINKPELLELVAAGVSVAFVYESTAGRALDGASAGSHDAQMALTALSELQIPSDRPVYFAIDIDAQPYQYGVIEDYFRAAGEVMGLDRIGAYGHDRVLARLQAAGVVTWLWQTYAWSGGRDLPGRHLYQYLNSQVINGGEVDYNYAYTADFGQWPLEEPMTPEELGRLERLEKLLAGNGIVVVKDPEHGGDPEPLTGEEALAWLASRGVSVTQLIYNQNKALTAHQENHGTGDHTHTAEVKLK